MHPDRERRSVIPLHGGDAERDSLAAESALYDLVGQCPADLRPAALELLCRMAPGDPALERMHAAIPAMQGEGVDAGQISAATAILRSAIHGDASAGAAVTRARHDALDAAVSTWQVNALAHRDEIHRRFMRDVSHDIRSPLNSILFLADALRGEHSGPLNEVQARQVDVLFMASVTLVKLVNDLIDFAHLDPDTEVHVASAPFSPGAVIEEIRNLVGPLLDYHRVTLMVNHSAASPRQGDGQLLNRVLLNLVTNAVQATPEDGVVTLTTEDDAATGGLIVSLADCGPGVDFDAVRTLVHRAADGADAPRLEAWTHGLGLSIAARLVAAAGGSLDVEEVEPRGTEFRILLPFGAL